MSTLRSRCDMSAHPHAVQVVAMIAVCALFATLPQSAHAHGGGLSLSATTTGYFVDVDYADEEIVSGETGRFDFKLFYDQTRARPVDFSKVWVRIIQKSDVAEGNTIFSGWIAKATLGPTGLSIALPSAGDYQLLVRYNEGETQIVEATLPFTVESETRETFFQFGVEFWSGIVAGALLSLFLVSFSLIRARLAHNTSA